MTRTERPAAGSTRPVVIGWSSSLASVDAAARAVVELGPTCRYVLVHAEGSSSRSDREAALAIRDRMAAFAERTMAPIEVVAAPGDPVDVLCDVARARNAGLVVLGWDTTRRTHPTAAGVSRRCLSAVALWPWSGERRHADAGAGLASR